VWQFERIVVSSINSKNPTVLTNNLFAIVLPPQTNIAKVLLTTNFIENFA
jgi:hypothetical protein